MPKRKKYYTKDENGNWTQVNEIPEFNKPEQISFAFDDSTDEDYKEESSIEFTFTPQDDLETFYKLYDPDDIRDKIIECVESIRHAYLNGVYYVSHAENTDDILKIDAIVQEDSVEACNKLAKILDVYVEACTNEYSMERDPIMKSFMANDLN